MECRSSGLDQRKDFFFALVDCGKIELDLEAGMAHRRTTPEVFNKSIEHRHNQTEAEALLWSRLRRHRPDEVHFRRQHAIGIYIVDFCAPRQKLVIEVDGGQHLEQADYDAERTAYLQAKGYHVLRFWNDEVIQDLEMVMSTIDRAFNPLPTLPHKAK